MFRDPINSFRCLHDNDIEILLLIGKAKVGDIEPARLSFFQDLGVEVEEKSDESKEKEESKEKDELKDKDQKAKVLYLVGYPASIK